MIVVIGLFAALVMQQPQGNIGYVSDIPNTVTQFNMAAEAGNLGFLAHSNQTGKYFPLIRIGQEIQYGNESFIVTDIVRARATTDPSSYLSEFVDLETGQGYTADQLFGRVYRGSYHLVLQTCVEQESNINWGRLFVIAHPKAEVVHSILQVVK